MEPVELIADVFARMRPVLDERQTDERRYPLEVRVPQSVMRSLRLQRADLHGEWNYSFNPER